jgi:hypothetical protein
MLQQNFKSALLYDHTIGDSHSAPSCSIVLDLCIFKSTPAPMHKSPFSDSLLAVFRHVRDFRALIYVRHSDPAKSDRQQR